MRRNPGFTLVELLVLVAIIAILAAVWVNFPVMVRAREAARKATCLSNVKQIALAALMYAQDYDEVLPACVADDEQGTAHAVGGVYQNRTREQFAKDVKTKYGEQYFDGRWMWQLADLLLPYIQSQDLFNCPTLVRRDPYSRIETYVIGTDKATGEKDPRDPLLGLVHGKNKRKVVQSGSYLYMCMHYPYGPGAQASSYAVGFDEAGGIPLFTLWDMAGYLGLLGKPTANPQNHAACANALTAFADPMRSPLAACDSLGVHEGYSVDYVRAHFIPPDLPRAFRDRFGLKWETPTIVVAMPTAFVDGHAKYMRMGFYDALALMMSPNKGG